MSRDLSANNLAEINANHLHEVIMVKLEFDAPVYVHSGIGTISYGGNSYLGVGDFGNVDNPKESELLTPMNVTLHLSGVDTNLIAESLDSGNYGDVVTIYDGYRQDDGTLVADPWVVWRGTYEYARASAGDSNVISVILQYDLAVLEEIDGSKFSDEDQQTRFAGDEGFIFVTDTSTVSLFWAGGRVSSGVDSIAEKEYINREPRQ